MAADRVRRVEELFLALREAQPEDRAGRLAAECGEDDELRFEVESLLLEHDRSNDDRPAGSVEAERDDAGGPASTSGDLGAELIERLGGREKSFGRYVLEGELARGGQGAILRVWDEDLRRNLAMKVTLAQGEAASASDVDPKTLGRFLEEAQVTGQLDHPGVVPIHELGLDDEGRVYFTMRLVNGLDLARVFAMVPTGEDGWSKTRVLGVLLKVCEALSYAHSKSVIHRDLKPANIMVGSFGEVYVMDWGLARVTGSADRKDIRVRPERSPTMSLVTSDRRERAESTDSPLLTMDGDVLGTPAYMSPEQARGDLEAVGPASDVYAMGAILYQLLAGHMPYVPPDARPDAYAVWRLVQAGPPEPVAQIAKDAPAELVAICEKAMAREPADRYADMSALAEDLRAFLERRVVSAYETGAVAELRKWVARNRPLATSIAAGLVAVVAGLLWAQHERAARRAEEARAALEREERDGAVESGVSLALGRADVHAEAQQWGAAEAAVQGARALARTAESPEAGLALVARHEASIARLRAAADFVLAADEIAQRIDVLFDWAETDARYVELFSTFGVDVDGSTPDRAAAALEASGVGTDVLPALDRWLVVRRNLERERARDERRVEDLAGARRLVALASELDDDPQRAELRLALLDGDVDALARKADELLLTLPPATLELVATALKLAGRRDEALRVLRGGALLHPDDYGLRATLLTTLRYNPVTPEWDRTECLGAMMHTQAALALRPQDPDLHFNMFWGYLALAWDAERRGDEQDEAHSGAAAVAQFDVLQSLRFRPSELLFRGWALDCAGREEEALEAFATLVREPPGFSNAFGRTPEEWRYWYFTRAGSPLLRGGALEDALLAFEPLLETDTGPAFGEWALARVLLRAREGDVEGALQVMHECVEDGPLDVPRASYWLTWSVARLSDSVLFTACGAATAAEQARVRPALEALRDEVLWFLIELDDAAVNGFRAAASAAPWPKGAQPKPTVLGMLLFRIGEDEEALEILSRVEGANAYEQYFMAMAHSRLGNSAEARAMYDRAAADTATTDLSSRGWEDLLDHLVFRDEAEALLGIQGGR